jgi:Cd2+/Zn2+-exporting ATPase
MIGRFSNLGVYRQLLRSSDFYRVVFAGGLAFASYWWDRGSDVESTLGIALALASVALNGIPIIWGAITGLFQRKLNVDELVAVAIIASLFAGEFLTAAVVSFVMVLGALIEEATTDKARKAIQALIKISPDTATVVDHGKPTTVPISKIKVGDTLLVKPGDRVPVDAVVTKGISAIDESSITGEPIPKEKTIGDQVYAGTLNQNGLMEVEANRVGEDTALGKVIRLVSEAEAHRPPTVRVIDRFAQWFTPTILACAAVAWWLTGDSTRAIAVLIVGCPCALILAAPTAVVAAIGRAARMGILVKGGQYLEEIGRSDVILFDKTGTLTQGEPRVDEIVSADGVLEREVLMRAACVEQSSSHPLARAVLRAAQYAKLTLCSVEDMVTEIGLGVRACVEGSMVAIGSPYICGGTTRLPANLRQRLEAFKEKGATPLVVYQDEKPLGVISVADHMRPSALETMEELRALGIKRLGVLSGDHEKSVRLVAEPLDLTDVWWELKPEEKLEVIEDLHVSGQKVVFVGDGINDAPALAAADVGVAMGAVGTDVALETADIALMNDDIAKIPALAKLSRRMVKVIKWNIAFGMVFNAIAVVASGWGLLTPIMGAVVHNIGSVLVVLSSASLAFTGTRTPTPAGQAKV